MWKQFTASLYEIKASVGSIIQLKEKHHLLHTAHCKPGGDDENHWHHRNSAAHYIHYTIQYSLYTITKTRTESVLSIGEEIIPAISTMI